MEYNVENIMTGDELDSLFSDPSEVVEEETNEEINKESKEEQDKTTEVDLDSLFEKPESVGSEENQEGEDTSTDKANGATPTSNNFYSSIAKALKEDGVLAELEDKDINDAESFAKAIEEYVGNQLDETQKRINNALNYGIEKSTIKQYEDALSYLNSIDISKIEDESEQGEELRKQLIYNDYLNRGYTKEQASKKLQKSIDSGSDVDDAKDALEGNKEFFTKQYNNLINEAKLEQEKFEKEKKEQSEQLKKSILDDKKVYGELDIDKVTRQKIYKNISEPVYRDKESGTYYTAIQKYQKDNPVEFLKNIGLVYTLTDGFKNLDGLVKSKVRKEINKNLKNLESTLTSTRNSGGSYSFVSGVNDKFSNGNWDIAID